MASSMQANTGAASMPQRSQRFLKRIQAPKRRWALRLIALALTACLPRQKLGLDALQ